MHFFLLISVFTFSIRSFAFEPTTKDAARSNPDIGANILLLGQAASSQSENDNGFGLQEMELQFSGAIDPYWSGSALLAIEAEADPVTGETEYAFEPEEVYFENLSLPGVSVRLGKQKLYFGKLNAVHTHAQPFIDLPLTVSETLGEEGLNESALSVSYLVKAPWYFEIIGQFFTGENDRVFASSTKGDPAEVLFVKNLWDLNDTSTFEWLLSAGTGKNKGEETSTLLNTAVTYKWRPSEGGRYTSFSFTGEYSQVDLESSLDDTDTLVENLDTIQAFSLWATYQFDQRWFVQGRTETAKTYYENNFSGQADLKKNTFLVGFIPTHFSAVRLQYDVLDNDQSAEKEHRVGLQFNFSMGAHPAHAY